MLSLVSTYRQWYLMKARVEFVNRFEATATIGFQFSYYHPVFCDSLPFKDYRVHLFITCVQYFCRNLRNVQVIAPRSSGHLNRTVASDRLAIHTLVGRLEITIWFRYLYYRVELIQQTTYITIIPI